MNSEEAGKYDQQRWCQELRNEGSLTSLPGTTSPTSETFSPFPQVLPELTSIEQPVLPSRVGHAHPAHPAPSFPILSPPAPSQPLFTVAKKYEHSTKRNPSCRIPQPSGCSSAFKDGAALKRGELHEGTGKLQLCRTASERYLSSLRGKLLLGCVSCQSLLFCRPKALFSAVRSCYHLQSHIKTVFVLRFDFPHTENSKRTGLLERKRGSASEAVLLTLVSWVMVTSGAQFSHPQHLPLPTPSHKVTLV